MLVGNQAVNREAIDSEHGRHFPFLVFITVNAQAQSVCDFDQEMGDSVSSPFGICPFRRDIKSSVRRKGKCKCLDRSQCLHVQAQLRQSLDRSDKFCMWSQGELWIPASALGLPLGLYKDAVLTMGSWALYLALCLLGAGEPNTQSAKSGPGRADPHPLGTLISQWCLAPF